MAFTILLSSGCADSDDRSGRLALDPEAEWIDDRLIIASSIDFEPSPAMREALEHGVDVQLDVVVRISRRYGPIARELERRAQAFRIHYLPLTEQWQLVEADGAQTYPRLWLLLRELARRRQFETGLERSAIGEHPLQVQVRAEINREALPPPMHLPTLFSNQWRFSAQWHSWHFDPS